MSATAEQVTSLTAGSSGSVAAAPPATGVSTGGSVSASTAAGSASTGLTIGSSDFTWNDGWREKLAKGDDKALKRLSRYQSPDDLWNAYRALDQKISAGELRSAMPKDATPEQMSKWRQENGIPEKPDAYDLTFETGLVVGDEDKPIIKNFLERAHAANLTNPQVKEAVKWYYDEVDRQSAERNQQDEAIAIRSQDALRAEWGNDYRPNINLIKGLMEMAPPELKDKFLGGRLADGTPIGSSVESLKWLAWMARQINPIATVVPGAGAHQEQAIDDEIKKLEGMMGNKNSEYWKGTKAEDNQKRYRELLSAKERMKK